MDVFAAAFKGKGSTTLLNEFYVAFFHNIHMKMKWHLYLLVGRRGACEKSATKNVRIELIIIERLKLALDLRSILVFRVNKTQKSEIRHQNLNTN